MLARVIEIATCLSVCPSVTRPYCVKTKKASGMISSPSGSPKTLVFWRKISSPNSKGFPPNGGLKQGSVGKIQRFLPARRYASAGYSDGNVSVCPSVCPSVTRRYCVKTKKASGMISSPSDSPKTLVFWRKISSPNSKGFPPNGSLKHGSVGKIQRFSSFKRQYLKNSNRYGQSYY